MKFRKARRAPYHQVQRHATWRPKRTRRQRGFKPFQVKYNYLIKNPKRGESPQKTIKITLYIARREAAPFRGFGGHTSPAVEPKKSKKPGPQGWWPGTRIKRCTEVGCSDSITYNLCAPVYRCPLHSSAVTALIPLL